ncbi:MAG: 30S ribosomal protein S4e [Candidatus Woesearchaeota archaeon]
MVKQHLKRLSSPRTWPIAKKSLTFVARPRPGAHKIDMQVPLSLALRDMIGAVETTKQAKFILHNKECLVDGKVVHDVKRPVGFMDVISLPKAKEHYRILVNKRNKLYAVKISEKESSQKIARVINKTTLKGGIMQLNTFDGRCVRVDDASRYAVGDSLILSLPDQKISDFLPLKKNATILLTRGSHVGEIGTIEDIEDSVVTVKTDDKTFRTKKEYAVVIGKTKPVITL